jgi:DNA-binding NtrC family response regulator
LKIVLKETIESLLGPLKVKVLPSDVAMPELSGIELAIRMKARHPGCRVLLFSGQAATADLLKEARGPDMTSCC